jgi:hypothetical protein
MASGLTFLGHICLYCQHLNQLQLTKLYCNNLGLVRKLNYFFTYRPAPIKCVLHSEYDVLAQSYLLLQEYLVTPKILNVKGHQDDKTPYPNLPLPAQLNCDVDSLATTELCLLPNLIKRLPLFPSVKVQLLISGKSVTRNISGAIRWSYGYHPLLAYCKASSGPNQQLTPLTRMASPLPFDVASNNKTLPSNFALAFYPLEKTFTETNLDTTTNVQRATNHKSATTTSFNAPLSVINAGATKPPQPSENN